MSLPALPAFEVEPVQAVGRVSTGRSSWLLITSLCALSELISRACLTLCFSRSLVEKYKHELYRNGQVMFITALEFTFMRLDSMLSAERDMSVR